MSSLPARYAEVAVLAQLGRAGGLYTYRLPDSLTPLVGPGSLVRVPFTSRTFQGIVCSLEVSTELPRVRDVSELLDPVPVLTGYQIQLARWIADYYAAPLSDVLGAMIPPGIGRKTVYLLEPGHDRNGDRLTPDQEQVYQQVCSAGRVSMDALQKVLPGVDVGRSVQQLSARGLISRVAELAPPRVSARVVRLVSIVDGGRDRADSEKLLWRAPLARDVLDLLEREGPLALSDLGRRYPGARGAVATLRRKGLVREQAVNEPRRYTDGRNYVETQPLALSRAQSEALRHIVESLSAARSDIFLLHGVTGSGKTEVYLQAIAATVTGGRQAIMMVPEIALTPQAVERVAGRFPGRVAVLHSKLTSQERVEEWQRIRHGEVDVVVGPRSALFAPVPRPGLIVVDEEHDPSYKQDGSPRYHARDSAAILGRFTGATVIYGSATPDVGTYVNAQRGKIKLLELPDRPVWHSEATGERQSRSMPPVQVVDMRQELKEGNRSIFSTPLQVELSHTLESRQQALLFLNRRGNATVVLCRDCGFVATCPNCGIPFTFHSSNSRLICHRCDKRATQPKHCPVCQSPRIRYLGVGTQRVEEEVKALFPEARVLRWDRDVTGGKEAHDRILKTFSRHEADILVGTQMIAKGLDFPLVTLVGVVSADTGLHFPDFRSPERSFQLLTQVAGRAGRASLPSKVIVQTYSPEHYSIQAAKDHDYHRFVREEVGFRQVAHYPPFGRLMRFIYSAESEERCRSSASELREILQRAIEERHVHAEIIGPAPCFVARIKNRHYWHLIARGEPRSGSLHPLLDYMPAGWSIDVDPVDLL